MTRTRLSCWITWIDDRDLSREKSGRSGSNRCGPSDRNLGRSDDDWEVKYQGFNKRGMAVLLAGGIPRTAHGVAVVSVCGGTM